MKIALTYVSRAVDPFSNAELWALREKADMNNLRLNITGCLVYYNGKFVQVLEGPMNNVNDLFGDAIRSDPRHQDIRILSSQAIRTRTFPNWGMTFYDPYDMTDPKSLEFFEDNLKTLSELTGRTNPTVLRFWNFVRSMLREGQSPNS